MAEVANIEETEVIEGVAPQGAAPATTTEQTTVEKGEGAKPGPTEQSPTEQKSFTVDEILAQHGISKDELKEFQDQKKAKQEEEDKPKMETQRWLDVLSHGVKIGAITKEDALLVEDLSKLPNEQVVFENFKKTVANPDNLTGTDFEEYAADEFADTYSTHNKSESAAKKRELLFKTEADQIRNEALTKIKTVEKEYSKVQLAASLTNQHKSLFAEISKKPITQTFKVKDEDVTIEVENSITEEEVTKALKSDEAKSLLNFMGMVHAEDPKAADEIYKSFVTSLSIAKTEEAKTQKIWEKAVEWAKKEYSIGSQAPFDSKQGANRGTDTSAKPKTKAEAQRELQSGQHI